MFQLLATSALEKILLQNIQSPSEIKELSILTDEVGNFQFVFSTDLPGAYSFEITGDPELRLRGYFVKNVPVGVACHPTAYSDDGYIGHEPGLYPDLLQPIDRDWVQANGFLQSIWIRVDGDAGEHEVTITFRNAENEIVARKSVLVHIASAALPEQKLIFTQWFYADCISGYYGCEALSERHWELMEKFLIMAYENGIKMILTPLFTPPTDTEVGKERPTVQLIGIKCFGDRYEFDFSGLRRWITLCKRIGFRYFEMPHLFTQWGAKATPKIMAEVNGRETRIFGWDHPSTTQEYDRFLSQFLPALIGVLKSEGIAEQTYFHISDEPRSDQLEEYSAAYRTAEKYLDGFKIIDAISDFEFYQNGILHIPVPAIDRIEPFLATDPEEKWCYYCCSQSVGVSNRFIALRSARNRSIGVQLFKYRIDGFLHWGYNFYFSQYSRLLVDPFLETDAYGTFPSGDSFSVYPGKDGPLPSIRLFVFFDALQDIRALQLLESYIGHDETVRFIEEILGEEIVFEHCFDAERLLAMREAVNEKIAVCASAERLFFAEA